MTNKKKTGIAVTIFFGISFLIGLIAVGGLIETFIAIGLTFIICLIVRLCVYLLYN